MPIANMDSANSPGILSYTLLMGEEVPLYVTTAGYFNATPANGATFGIPPQSSVWRGAMWVQAVPNVAPGGTGAISLALYASLNGGTNFGLVAAAAAAWTGGVGSLVKFDVSGLGGNGQLYLASSAITLGSASGFNIYARIG